MVNKFQLLVVLFTANLFHSSEILSSYLVYSTVNTHFSGKFVYNLFVFFLLFPFKIFLCLYAFECFPF